MIQKGNLDAEPCKVINVSSQFAHPRDLKSSLCSLTSTEEAVEYSPKKKRKIKYRVSRPKTKVKLHRAWDVSKSSRIQLESQLAEQVSGHGSVVAPN